jgi:hypothetical protein
LQIGSSIVEQPRPVSHTPCEHCTFWQLLFPTAHFTSHAHEFSHATVSHELMPVQFRKQPPGPHMTPRHESRPLHWMVHEVASRQWTPLRHSSSTEQRMSQLKPIGQRTWALQFVLLFEQSMMQTLPMHSVHCAGHV